MRGSNWLAACVLSGVIGLSAAPPSLACAFHGYTPDPTIVDALLLTEQVVTARLAAPNSNRYVVVETLLGPQVTDIPLEPSRTARQGLSGDPQATVLLIRDGSYGPWGEIAILDASYREIVQVVLRRQSDWLYGGGDGRLKFFAKLVNHPNPQVQRLVLKELDRAPYAALKRLRTPKVRGLAQALQGRQDDLTPIRVLMAGLSGDRALTPLLSAQMDQAIRDDVPYLGAYATALVELEGRAAVEDILNRHLRSGQLSEESSTRLLQALALQHKVARGSVRRFIAREMAALLRTSPELSEAAALQFGYSETSRLLRKKDVTR